MYHQGKYTRKSDTKSPCQTGQEQHQRNQEPLNIDLLRFADATSSIWYDSKLDCQRVDTLHTQFTQYEPCTNMGELSTLERCADT